jgi:hypothetical protein
MKNMIDITNVDLIKFVKRVYELSLPQGLGFLHYKTGGLTDEEAKSFIIPSPNSIAINMDYVKGRACKMVVWREGTTLYIRNSWYDHMDEQLRELLISTLPTYKELPKINTEHSISCNCLDCQSKRFLKGN